MSFRVVRQSRFRHVFGQALKRDQCYDNIRITKSSWDSTFCAINPKYVAIITEAAGGGSFLVVTLDKTGRVDRDAPLVAGHKGAVLDIQWCPHNDDVVASASEDCTVKVWQIPEGGLRDNLSEPVVDLVAHQRRVGLVVWHPSAQNILLSGGSDNKVFIWNVGIGEALIEIDCFPDIVLCAAWNWDGSRIVTSCKDKKIRVIDPRTGDVLKESFAHEGSKPVQVIYLKNGKIFTTGFSRMSERQYALWDGNMKNIVIQEIDTSNGVIFPFYDPDTNIVYLCGKGDSVIRYFEVTDESPYVHYLAVFQSSTPQRGIGWMPKRGLDVNTCEIARFYKLHQAGLCEIISMTVPRKSELFQDDLYPDTVSDMPAISAEDWIEGVNAEPIMMSLRDNHKSAQSGGPKGGAIKKPNVLNKAIKKPALATTATAPPPKAHLTAGSHAAPAASPAAAPAASQDGLANVNVAALVEEFKVMRTTIREQETRIRALEAKIAKYEKESEDAACNSDEEAELV